MSDCKYRTTDVGAERPMCDCGVPMMKKGRRHGRQSWRCPTEEAARRDTPEYKASQKARNATPERKAAKKAYQASPKGQATREAWENANPYYHYLWELDQRMKTKATKIAELEAELEAINQTITTLEGENTWDA